MCFALWCLTKPFLPKLFQYFQWNIWHHFKYWEKWLKTPGVMLSRGLFAPLLLWEGEKLCDLGEKVFFFIQSPPQFIIHRSTSNICRSSGTEVLWALDRPIRQHFLFSEVLVLMKFSALVFVFFCCEIELSQMIRFHKVALAFEKEQHNMIRWGEMRRAGGDQENNSLIFFH